MLIAVILSYQLLLVTVLFSFKRSVLLISVLLVSSSLSNSQLYLFK